MTIAPATKSTLPDVQTKKNRFKYTDNKLTIEIVGQASHKIKMEFVAFLDRFEQFIWYFVVHFFSKIGFT